jgi:single-strand DNA-binding protein
MLNNRVILKGNLTKDPEYKTVSDKELVSFRIAVNESVGNGKEETVYMDVDGWGSHAGYARDVSLSKGDRVIIDGRLRQRNWEDKTGVNRTSYTVLPSTFSKVVKPAKAGSDSNVETF